MTELRKKIIDILLDWSLQVKRLERYTQTPTETSNLTPTHTVTKVSLKLYVQPKKLPSKQDGGR